MIRIHLVCATALAMASSATAQLPVPPSNFPRVFSMGDNFTPTGTLGWYHFKLASSNQLLPAQGTLPTTANFVHCTYGDTDNFVPQYEYRYSTSGGFSWSGPVVLHKLTSGELVYDNEPQLVCEGRNVFFALQSNLGIVGGGTTYAIYAYGSNDMGTTWQGPLLMSPGFAGANPTWTSTTPVLDAAAAGGRLHVTYEAHRVSNAGGNEECLYANAEFNTSGTFVLLKSDVDMSKLPNPTTIDVDNPHIAADGKVVAVIWLDNRNSGTATTNETFVRVSRDAGANFDKEVDVSQPNTTPNATSTDTAWVAVSNVGQGSIYCTYQDGRTGGGDKLYLMYSKDGGATWVRTDQNGARIMLSAPGTNDVDQHKIAADGQTVAIAWMDDLGQGNSFNQLRVIVDPLGGLGWQIGTNPSPIDLSAGVVTDVQIVEEICLKGNFIAISHEANSPTISESAALSWSCDKGLTWETRIASDGTADVDEPFCDVTLNGDINMIYLEDRAGGQSNTTVVTGLKVPTLVNDASATQGIKVSCAMGSVGNIALTLFTGTLADMTGNNPPVTFNNTGFALNLTNDIAFNVGISVAFAQPAVYFGTVDNNGNVAFPGIANFSSLLGVPIYCAVATAQANLTLGEFTDPVKLR